MPKSSIEIPTPSLRKIGTISSWNRVLVTKASSVTSIMKRRGKPVASSASANERMNPGLLACLAATLMLIVAVGPKVSLMRSIDRTISASTRWVSSSIKSEFDREVDERAGRLNDALVVAQANQRLDAFDFLGPDIDLGLEGAAEALLQDRVPQRLLDLHARERLALHAGVEEGDRALAVVLDPIHRDVGILAATRHSCGRDRDRG